MTLLTTMRVAALGGMLLAISLGASATVRDGSDVAELLQQAASKDPDQRAGAMERSSTQLFVVDSTVNTMVLAGLSDPSPVVRRAAAFALAERPRLEAADGRLVSALEDEDESVRTAAAYAIGVQVIPSDAAAKLLQSLSTKSSAGGRLFYAFALQQLGRRSPANNDETALASVPALLAGLSSPKAEATIRLSRAIAVVSQAVSVTLVPMLAEAAKIEPLAGNAFSAGAQLAMRHPTLTEVGLALMTSKSAETRMIGVRSLGLLGLATAPTLSALSDCVRVEDRASPIQLACIESLGALGSGAAPEAAALLEGLLSSDSQVVRATAAHALFRVDTLRLQASLDKLSERDPELARTMRGRLSLLTL